ncbi:MAG: SDR family NAD(P)-dependent oxidoreductase [Alphaproteobacteria bacterium]|nr:SDR family NAD(P)-dependent oxidoreductase [Alphaproteobacteria bacterium]
MNKFEAVIPSSGCAWVTGASSGIGRAVALALAREGWRVAVSARGKGGLFSLAQEAASLKGSIHPYSLDVTDPRQIADGYAAITGDLGPVALAVLNAGIYLPVEITGQFDAAPFSHSMQVNYMGTVHCLAPLLPDLMARGMGHVLIVSSVTGYGGLPRSAAYGPTKAALINLAESLKFDLDRAGVRISVACPGFVDTPATANNPFPMPFLMPADEAAQRILAGIQKGGFEITFPRRFTYVLKVLNMLPYRIYFQLVKRLTGWN